MKILLVIPPFTQLNTPYPSVPYLYNFLSGRGESVFQADLGIETILSIFSERGIRLVADELKSAKKDESADHFIAICDDYTSTIDRVIAFLQGRDKAFAHRICRRLLPEGERFKTADETDWAFGTIGIEDRARFLATLYLEDISDTIRNNIDRDFGFTRYAESIALSATSFAPVEERLLNNTLKLTERLMIESLEKHIEECKPELVCFTVPFPGNIYSALRCSKHIKENYPKIRIAMGGGYPNTELRDLKSEALFKYLDFVTLDDGELPLSRIISHLKGECGTERLRRTFILQDGRVKYIEGDGDDFCHRETGYPDYTGLDLSNYLSLLEIANPMQRLWSDGRWNKMTVAHGCYWKRCSFCDTTLDYIKRFDTVNAAALADRIERIIKQTGESGFHFVDEAAPPKVLKDMALEILKRKLQIEWWTNIRFDSAFTPDLCKLLAASGCIAVSGGLEAASERILKMIDKGVSIEQVAQVTRSFSDAGIMVHAYLMYGFPTETKQETVDSLEVVRQLFENGCVHSAFWHRFSMTAHSKIGKNPEEFSIRMRGPEKGDFAYNDLLHEDRNGADPSIFTAGLNKATYNFMHGNGLDFEISSWFEFNARTNHKRDMISKYISKRRTEITGEKQILWPGNTPAFAENKGKSSLVFHEKEGTFAIHSERKRCEWFLKTIKESVPASERLMRLSEAGKEFKDIFNEDLEEADEWRSLAENGLLLI